MESLEKADSEKEKKKCCDCNSWSKCVYKAKCRCSKLERPCTNCPSRCCEANRKRKGLLCQEKKAAEPEHDAKRAAELESGQFSAAANEIEAFDEEE